MPHAIISYSQNMADTVKASEIVRGVHAAMIDSGLFAPEAVKTRAHATQDFLVGIKDGDAKFIHVVAYLMEGRTVEQKSKLSQAIFDAVSQKVKNIDSISVDVRDMAKDIYRKS